MGSCRKQRGEIHLHNQVGNWSRSSFNNRKPHLDIWQPTVPRWEKMFCSTIGLVPWQKLVETKKYMHLHGNVMDWDDSAAREAFHNAKSRFWAATNGFPCNISLPDPDIYIDDIDWNLNVDPELLLDLERDATVPGEKQRDEEVVILGSPFLLDQSFSCIGWGEAEADAPKHTDFSSGAPINRQHENIRKGALEQHRAPYGVTKVYDGLQNHRKGNWEWNQRESYHHTDAYKMGVGRGGWNRGRWNGFKRYGENMSWNKTQAYHHGDEYEMNRGRRNCRGKRISFSYDHKTPAA